MTADPFHLPFADRLLLMGAVVLPGFACHPAAVAGVAKRLALQRLRVLELVTDGDPPCLTLAGVEAAVRLLEFYGND
jgi:hypothetical protein